MKSVIRFSLTAEQVVVNTTVRINSQIVAIVIADMTEQALKADIRQVMTKFIEADWQFSNMARSSDATGLERVTITATARVPETENYALERRAREASRDGLRITSWNVDTSPTTQQVEDTESKLRLDLLTKVKEQAKAIIKATGIDYQVVKVVFNPDEILLPSNVRGGSKGAVIASASSYGSGFGAGDTLGNAVKLTMQADVTLRQKV